MLTYILQLFTGRLPLRPGRDSSLPILLWLAKSRSTITSRWLIHGRPCSNSPSQRCVYISSIPEKHIYSTLQVKAVGVSNFTIEHLEGIIKATGVVPVRAFKQGMAREELILIALHRSRTRSKRTRFCPRMTSSLTARKRTSTSQLIVLSGITVPSWQSCQTWAAKLI